MTGIEDRFETTRGRRAAHARRRVSIDTPIARGIVDCLANGQARLQDCRKDTTIPDHQMVAHGLALVCANVITPATPLPAAVTRLNAALADIPDIETGLGVLALPCGTALNLGDRLQTALRSQYPTGDDLIWANFLNKIL